MANRSRQTFIKRQKERARQEKARQKSERRSSKKEARDANPELVGADLGIDGIIPGPQPVPWETEDLLTPEEKMALLAEKEAEAKAQAKAKEKEKAAAR